MANPTAPTRLSPAELRRRLLSPPLDSASPQSPSEEAAPPPRPSQRRDASRLGGATQASIDLDALLALPSEAAPPPRPAARRESNRFGGATQMAIDLDALAQESGAPSNGKHTPLPENRLDASRFRAADAAPPAAAKGADETSLLRIQNAELTRIIEEMRPLIEEATAQEMVTQTKEKEFQDHLAEKDLLLEEAQLRVKQLEEQLLNVPAPRIPKTRDELEEWNDELEKEGSKLSQERRRLDDDRRQLQEDEESLEKQMREMECSMARERAMMARQETELKRLSAEIQHELELLQRGDGTLREQLSKFQRRHQEVLSRSLGSGAGATAAVLASPESPPPGLGAPAKKDSGLFGRIFRGNK